MRKYVNERDVYQMLRSIRERSETFDLLKINFRKCLYTPRSVARYMRYT